MQHIANIGKVGPLLLHSGGTTLRVIVLGLALVAWLRQLLCGTLPVQSAGLSKLVPQEIAIGIAVRDASELASQRPLAMTAYLMVDQRRWLWVTRYLRRPLI